MAGEPFHETGTNRAGTLYRLSPSPACAQKLPGFVGQAVMVAEGKIYRRILETQVPHPARDAGTPDAGAAGARTAQVRSAPDAGPQEYMYVPGGPLPPGEGTAAATPPDAGQR